MTLPDLKQCHRITEQRLSEKPQGGAVLGLSLVLQTIVWRTHTLGQTREVKKYKSGAREMA